MVVVQMGQEHHANIGRIDVGAHHLPRRAFAAVEQIVFARVEGNKNGGLAAVGVGQCGASAQHGDFHESLLERLVKSMWRMDIPH